MAGIAGPVDREIVADAGELITSQPDADLLAYPLIYDSGRDGLLIAVGVRPPILASSPMDWDDVADPEWLDTTLTRDQVVAIVENVLALANALAGDQPKQSLS